MRREKRRGSLGALEAADSGDAAADVSALRDELGRAQQQLRREQARARNLRRERATLELELERRQMAAADIEVWCQLHSHGRPVGQPERTCNAPGSQLRWNEWLSFSAHYRDLSADASVTLRLVGSSGARATRVVAEASARLFDDDGRSLHTGELKLPLTLLPPPDADGGGAAAPSAAAPAAAAAAAPAAATPTGSGGGGDAEKLAELAALEAQAESHERALAAGDASLQWLDGPTFDHLEARMAELSATLERHFVSVRLPDFECASGRVSDTAAAGAHSARASSSSPAPPAATGTR